MSWQTPSASNNSAYSAMFFHENGARVVVTIEPMEPDPANDAAFTHAVDVLNADPDMTFGGANRLITSGQDYTP